MVVADGCGQLICYLRRPDRWILRRQWRGGVIVLIAHMNLREENPASAVRCPRVQRGSSRRLLNPANVDGTVVEVLVGVVRASRGSASHVAIVGCDASPGSKAIWSWRGLHNVGQGINLLQVGHSSIISKVYHFSSVLQAKATLDQIVMNKSCVALELWNCR